MFTVYIRSDAVGQKYSCSNRTPPLTVCLLLEVEVVVVGAARVEGRLAVRADAIAA